MVDYLFGVPFDYRLGNGVDSSFGIQFSQAFSAIYCGNGQTRSKWLDLMCSHRTTAQPLILRWVDG